MANYNFSLPELDNGYKLEGVEVDNSLDGLLAVPKAVIDSCLNGQILPPGFQDSLDGETNFDTIIEKFGDEDFLHDILEQNTSFVSAVVMGFILAALLPLTAILCCCVSCCCRKAGCCCCTGSSIEKRQGRSILKIVGITILGVLACIGFVWNFAAVNRMYSTDLQIPEFVDDTLGDFDLFVKNVELEMDYLLENNFNETVDNFNLMLDSSIEDMKSILDDTKKNIQFDEVVDTIELFSKFVYDCNGITVDVQNLTSQIKNIEEQCIVLGANCDFLNLTNNILSPVENMNFDAEITGALDQVDSALESVNSEFDAILSDFTDVYFSKIDNQIEDIRKTLVQQNDEIKKALEEVKISHINWDKNWESYTNYFYISATVFISFLLVIVILFLIPGWNVAKIAASIYLTIGFIYFLVIAVFFAVGSLGEKAVCTTIDDPANSEFIPLFDDALQDILESAFGMEESDGTLNITLAGVLGGIEKEESVYPLLQLYHLYNVYDLKNNWTADYDIDSYIGEAKDALEETINTMLAMQNGIPNLDKLLGDTTTTIEGILNTAIINVINTNIDDLISDSDIDTLPPDAQTLLRALKESFTSLQTDVIDSISMFVDKTSPSGYNFNLNEIAMNLSAEFDYAFEYIGSDGRKNIEGFLDSFVDNLLGVVQTFLDFAVLSLDSRIGNTKPLKNMVNALDSVICDAFIDSINLAWTGLGWICILLYFPMSIWVLFARDWPYTHQKKSKKKGNDKKYKDQWSEMKEFQ